VPRGTFFEAQGTGIIFFEAKTRKNMNKTLADGLQKKVSRAHNCGSIDILLHSLDFATNPC
jgi:hypothetical protein